MSTQSNKQMTPEKFRRKIVNASGDPELTIFNLKMTSKQKKQYIKETTKEQRNKFNRRAKNEKSRQRSQQKNGLQDKRKSASKIATMRPRQIKHLLSKGKNSSEILLRASA